MERFQALIFALCCMLILPWFIYTMILLWQYKEWIALVLIFAFIFTAIRLLQMFNTWQRVKTGIMVARMEKEQLMSHVIAEREVVVLILEDWTIEHLSAEHERAKAFASTRLQVKEEVSKEGPASEEWVIIELAKGGMDPHNIAMSTRTSPQKVIQIMQQNGLWLAERVQKGGVNN